MNLVQSSHHQPLIGQESTINKKLGTHPPFIVIPHFNPRPRKPMPHIDVKWVHPTLHNRPPAQRAVARTHTGVQIKLPVVRQALPLHLHAPALQPPRAVPDRADGLVVELQEEAVVRKRDDVHVPEGRLGAALAMSLQRRVDVAVECWRRRRPVWVFRAEVVEGVSQDFDALFPVAQAREERKELVYYGHVVWREFEHCEESTEGL